MKVLFVCTGNICRSPSGEGMFRDKLMALQAVDKITVDSCGTSDWHIGDGPDSRSVAAAANRGIDISMLRARQLDAADFDVFDILFAMDKGHFDKMQAKAPAGTAHKIRMFLEPVEAQFNTIEVPDPYYGGEDGFELVLDMLETGSDVWIKDLLAK